MGVKAALTLGITPLFTPEVFGGWALPMEAILTPNSLCHTENVRGVRGHNRRKECYSHPQIFNTPKIFFTAQFSAKWKRDDLKMLNCGLFSITCNSKRVWGPFCCSLHWFLKTIIFYLRKKSIYVYKSQLLWTISLVACPKCALKSPRLTWI